MRMEQKLPGHTSFKDAGDEIPFVSGYSQNINILFFDKIFDALLNIHCFKQAALYIVFIHGVIQIPPDIS